MIVHIAAIFAMAGLALGQILLKILASYIANLHPGSLRDPGILMQIVGRFCLAAVVYGVVFLLWMFVLRSLALNRAFLYAALTFVFVPILSYLLLDEPVHTATIVGSVIIVLGVGVSFSF